MRISLIAVASLASLAVGSMALASVSSSPATRQVAMIDGLPEGEGRELTAQVCTQCHAIGMVTSQRHDRAEWDDVIGRMVDDQGLSASDEDLAVISAYLAEHFGKPDAKPAKAG